MGLSRVFWRKEEQRYLFQENTGKKFTNEGNMGTKAILGEQGTYEDIFFILGNKGTKRCISGEKWNRPLGRASFMP